MTEASWPASMQAEYYPWSFPFQFVHKAYQHCSFRLRLFDTCRKLVGLSLPSGQILLFLFDPALLDKNVLAGLAIAVAPAHTLVVGQLRSTSLSRAPFSRALLFHVTPFPISARIINPLEIAHALSWSASALQMWLAMRGSLLVVFGVGYQKCPQPQLGDLVGLNSSVSVLRTAKGRDTVDLWFNSLSQ